MNTNFKLIRRWICTLVGCCGCLLTVLAQEIPLEEWYTMGLRDKRFSTVREGVLYARMIPTEECGLPLNDLTRLSLLRSQAGDALVLTFRFAENYRALERAIHSLEQEGAYGPVPVVSGTLSMRFWYLPKQRLKVGLAVSGAVAANGQANYRYSIVPMDDVEIGGFYLDQTGRWCRLHLNAPDVLLSKVQLDPTSVRSLRPEVCLANRVSDYIESVGDSCWILHKLIPRKELPAIGQYYVAPAGSVRFPDGFAGKVVSVTSEKEGFRIRFGKVYDFELFERKE